MMLNNIQAIKEKFASKIEQGQYLKKIIRNLVENGKIEKAKTKIYGYKNYFPKDIEIVSIKAAILIMEGRTDIAKQCVLDGLERVPFNFDLNYNLGFIYQMKEQYQESTNAYIMAKKVSTNEKDKVMIQESLTEIKRLDHNIDFSKEGETSYKFFPLKNNNNIWIGDTLFEDGNSEGYIPLYYNESLTYPINLWNYYKTETLKGKKYKKGEIVLDNIEQAVLPVAALGKDPVITISIGNEIYKFDDWVLERFYYIPVTSKGKIKIISNNDCIIGKPLPIKQKKKHNIKMALCLFIDGLSQELISEYSLERLMPNTYEFFKKGTTFNNCYSNGEWTLPSVPSIFSGKYQPNHKIYHPELPHIIGRDYDIISQYFQKDEYLTLQICGNWRKSPSYGYVKGFDRTIYQSATVGSKIEDIIPAFLEHMRAFEGRDKFTWLSFFELHNVADNTTPRISNQILNGIESKVVDRDNKKSVRKGYDENKIKKYINEISRIDFYLKIIYDFIESNYENDEILISLFSDHGQSYLDEGSHILRKGRTHIPFMIRGGDIPASVSEDLVESVDILPTMLSKCGIEFNPDDIDGMVPNTLGGKEIKEYVYSESMYPGATYKAVIRDNEHTLTFESEHNVEQDGRVALGKFNIKLENNLTHKDETYKDTEKIERYFNVIVSHMSEFLKV